MSADLDAGAITTPLTTRRTGEFAPRSGAGVDAEGIETTGTLSGIAAPDPGDSPGVQ